MKMWLPKILNKKNAGWVDLGDCIVAKKAIFIVYDHVAYQIEGNIAYNNLFAYILLLSIIIDL